MTYLTLMLTLACQIPGGASTSGGPVAVRAAATDLPATDLGLADDCPTPAVTIDLEEERVGVSVPNAIKGMAVAWDPERQELWHAGIFSSWLIAHDPETGAPLRAVDIDVEGFNPATLHIDAERRRMVWVNSRKEQIRVVDLDSGKLIHRLDVEARGDVKYPTDSNALDIGDGRVWVYNANNRQLNGYDLDGGETRPLTGITKAFDLSAAPSGGKVAVLDAVSKTSGRALVVDTASGSAREVCSFTGRPPKFALMMDDGGLVLGDKTIKRVDASCKDMWSVEVGETPSRMAVVGDTLVAPLALGGTHKGGIGSEIALIDLATGTLQARVPGRFEAKHMAIDVAHNRVFVGNGGDGSATVISLDDPSSARTLPLASSADDVVVDPPTGDVYILSRLGGSRIWKRSKDGTVELFNDQAAWPFAMELDVKRRLLIAASYFDAKLHVWPLDGGAMRTTSLGIPGSTGDALGELGYDPETGVAAVVLPMEGWISVVDVNAGKVRYTRQFEEMACGEAAGPGHASITAANNSVYVAIPGDNEIWRMSQDSAKILAEGSLSVTSASPAARDQAPGGRQGRGGARDSDRPQRDEARPPRDGAGRAGRKGARPERDGQRPPRDGDRPQRDERPQRDGDRPAQAQGQGGGQGGGRPAGDRQTPDRGSLYAFNMFHYDAIGGRLFFGSKVLDPDTLALRQVIDADLKVAFSDATRIVALAVGANGAEDQILVLDAKTLAVNKTIPALSTPTAHAEAAFDPKTGIVYLADLPRARVTGFQVD